MGFPIRIFLDQSSFAAPQNFSQRTTSFIASQCQGIHRMPLRRLIALIVDTHPSDCVCNPKAEPPLRDVSLAARFERAANDTTRKTFLLHTIRSTSAGLKAALVLQDPMSVLCKGSELLDHSFELPNRSPPGNNRIVPLHNVKQPAHEPLLLGRRNPPQTLSLRMRTSRRQRRRDHFFLHQSQAIATQAMVEPDGIEPTTSCLQSTRSPS